MSLTHMIAHKTCHVFHFQGTQTFAAFAAASLAKMESHTHASSRAVVSSKVLRGGFASYKTLTISHRKALVQDTQKYVHSLVNF